MYHGVAQAMTGMVTPRAVSTSLRLPQFVVLTKYRPSGSGAPTARPTVSPGCVTEPARAEAAVQSDNTPAAANFINLLLIWYLPRHRSPVAGLGSSPVHPCDMGASAPQCVAKGRIQRSDTWSGEGFRSVSQSAGKEGQTSHCHVQLPKIVSAPIADAFR